AQLGGELVETGGVARHDDEVVAAGGERDRERTSDARRRARDERGVHVRSSALATVAALASTGSSTCTSAIARFGSLSPCPVTVHTATSSGASRPSAAAWSRPATAAADAGSTKQPSSAASIR